MRIGFWLGIGLVVFAVAVYVLALDSACLLLRSGDGPALATGARTPASSSQAAGVKPAMVMPNTYRCRKIDRLIAIDGRGTDPAWGRAPWTADFVDIQGDRKPTPRFRTRAKMLWNQQYLYVYAELEEPHVWATLTQKNAIIFHDNDFEVFIDPERSGENYYEFEMNALNTIWELTLVKRYTMGGPAILGTNLPCLVSAVSIDGTLNDPRDIDHGWSVEIAFPFSGLASHCRNGACPPNAGDCWRINFSRVEWLTDIIDGQYRKRPGTREDNWVWSPQGLVDMHQPEHWGSLIFQGQ